MHTCIIFHKYREEIIRSNLFNFSEIFRKIQMISKFMRENTKISNIRYIRTYEKQILYKEHVFKMVFSTALKLIRRDCNTRCSLEAAIERIR